MKLKGMKSDHEKKFKGYWRLVSLTTFRIHGLASSNTAVTEIKSTDSRGIYGFFIKY